MEENNCNRGAQSRLPLVGPGDQNLIRKEALAAGRFAPGLQAHSSMRKCSAQRTGSDSGGMRCQCQESNSAEFEIADRQVSGNAVYLPLSERFVSRSEEHTSELQSP